MMNSIEEYKSLISEIYKIHSEVLQDKPELFETIQERIRIKEE